MWGTNAKHQLHQENYQAAQAFFSRSLDKHTHYIASVEQNVVVEPASESKLLSTKGAHSTLPLLLLQKKVSQGVSKGKERRYGFFRFGRK